MSVFKPFKTLKKYTRSFFILFFITSFTFIVLTTAGCCKSNPQKDKDIRLVVMVVIDQLRADIITRMENRFKDDGFRYLINHGTWYQNARYGYATTITAVGHATIFTGTTPSVHGITGNSWFDQENKQKVFSTSIFETDPSDPQKKVEIYGPYQLLTSTIGDEFIMSSNRKNRVFSISYKDRGAILPGGRLGKAFWYDRKNGQFRTAPYYYKEDPAWLTSWNNRKDIDQYKKQKWELLEQESNYIYRDTTDNTRGTFRKSIKEKILASRSNDKNVLASFPHSLTGLSEKDFYDQLFYTPFGDEFTVDFTCYVMEKEKIGQNGTTDMLTLSLSCTDTIGHSYGPDSLEYEDNILRVDQSLSKLFNYIDEKVGLQHTLIVLTGDHGVDSVPEYRELNGLPTGVMDPKEIKALLDKELQTQFIKTDKKNINRDKNNQLIEFVEGFWNPSLYLKLETIKELGLNIEEVEKTATQILLTQFKGISVAVTRSDILKGNLPDTLFAKDLINVFNPERSGNILIIQKPHWYLYSSNDDPAMHGSPYSYDNHVPLFFVGPGIKKQSVYRQVRPWDIVGTLALKLGIESPAAASQDTLVEIFD